MAEVHVAFRRDGAGLGEVFKVLADFWHGVLYSESIWGLIGLRPMPPAWHLRGIATCD